MTLQRRRLTTPAIPPASDILAKAEAKSKARPRTKQGCYAGSKFVKGNTLSVGRKLRGVNKHTRILREACILAMEAEARGISRRDRLQYCGVTTYLQWAARREPAAFLSFCARAILPIQVKQDLGMEQVIEVRFRRIEEVKLEFEKRGLPLPAATVFALEHHADIDDAVASPSPSPERTTPTPATPPATHAPALAPAQPEPEVLPPAKPRIPAHLQRYARPPILYRELIEQEAADAS
jgi:hypothetical protein